MKNKKFDCVEMKRSAAEKIEQQLETLSPGERLAFWRQGEEELRRVCRTDLPTRRKTA